jgi:ribosome-associated protein
LEKILTAIQEKKKPIARLNKNSKLFKTIINSISDKKGEQTAVLDLRKITEAVADYFILCDARNPLQIKAIADHIADEVEINCGEKPYHIEYGEKWTLVDFVNVVVHIFQHDHRDFYGLESLWADAERTEY